MGVQRRTYAQCATRRHDSPPSAFSRPVPVGFLHVAILAIILTLLPFPKPVGPPHRPIQLGARAPPAATNASK